MHKYIQHRKLRQFCDYSDEEWKQFMDTSYPGGVVADPLCASTEEEFSVIVECNRRKSEAPKQMSNKRLKTRHD